MNYLKHTVAFFLMLALFSCDKREEQPLDYISCKIDGVSWEAKSDVGFTNYRTAHVDGSVLVLHGSNSSQNNTIELAAGNTSKELVNGTYTLGTNPQNMGSYRDYKVNSRYGYDTDSIHRGTIQYAFNKDKSRVDGTFSFIAKFEAGEKTVEVTEGKFSLPIR